MRYETRTVRVGEKVGDVDWGYDFRSHFDCVAARDDAKDELCERAKARLRLVEETLKAGGDIRATNYGGWPRCGIYRVCDVGMCDGWPYWRPVPSVYVSGYLGGEWWPFSTITDVYLGDSCDAVRLPTPGAADARS